MVHQILLFLHILLAFAIIGLVLLQHGKGAEVGAAFGSGASQTLFGSQGSASFLTKLTTLLAIGFAATSIGLGYVAGHQGKPKSIAEKIGQVQLQKEVPKVEIQVPEVSELPVGVPETESKTE